MSEILEALVGKIVLALAREGFKGSIYAVVQNSLQSFPSSKRRTLTDADIATLAKVLSEVIRIRPEFQSIDETRLREIIRSEIQRSLRETR
ncbi:hypothetical protein [Infirmifilum uzonense]|uniref:hypothetical protein n=1 Tax=Infirmifilum uzonense TaxID=1550241 RepID=UPI003C783268